MGRPAILKVDIVADAKGVGSGVDQANSRFGKLGSAAKTMGQVVAGGLAAAAAGAVALGASSIRSASDLQQAYGAVDSVFGKQSGQIKKWAGDAAEGVGLAKTEYANLASVIGSQLNNMGVAQDQVAGKTGNLIKLGADLAATYGGTTSEAVEALSSVLKGETDPIERYGVSIKQSDISARLAAEGLDGLTGAAGKQATAQAVLGLVTEQTTAAHGQFGRESDSLAGKQQILTAKWENAKATLGSKLLPAAVAVATWFSDKFMPAAQRLASSLGEKLGPTITAVGGFITDKLVPAARSLISWFMDKLVPAITSYVQPVLAGIRSAFHSVSGSIDDNSGNLKTLGHFLGVVIPPVAKALAKLLGGTVGTAFKVLGKTIGLSIDVISGLVGAVRTAVSWLDKMVGLIGKAKSAAGSGLSFLSGGIFGANPNVVGMVGQTAGGWAGPMAIGPSMATASLGAGGFSYGGGGMPAAAGGLYVDRRQVHVRIDGAFDPVAVAHQLEAVLKGYRVTTGRAATYGATP